MRQVASEVLPKASPERAREMQKLLDLAEETVAYAELQDQIEAAGEALEAHHGEFEKLMSDHQAVAERVRHLFSEDDFASLRHTAEDAQRAFEAVGYPDEDAENAQAGIDTYVSAIVHLADKDYRLHATRRLMMLLPKYVAAGRYLDAWLIQFCACQCLEAPQVSNPFLAEMFYHGMVAREELVLSQREAVMRELGIDGSAVAGRSFEEVEAWANEVMADPAKKALLEARLQAQPILRAQAETQLRDVERGGLHLLDREDAGALCLSPEELEPWAPRLAAEFEPLLPRLQAVPEQEMEVDEETSRQASDAFMRTAEDMAGAIFTPERLRRLAADLRAYAQRLREAGEQKAAAHAESACLSLRHVANPAENPFVVGVCYASLRSACVQAAQQAQARVTGEGSSEAAGGEGLRGE